MKKHIICFGDSNTHGYCADPADTVDGGIRFTEDERWTCLLQKELGDDYLVTEEGLSGRTTCFEDPLTEGMSSLPFITPCLKSHEFVDLLIIMLGTNDTKDRFGVNAECISYGMGRLVKKAMDTDCWAPGSKPNILVIAPPPIGDEMPNTEVGPGMGEHCVEKSKRLAACYREQCELIGCHFLDAAELGCEFNNVDYMHLTKKAHATLASELAKRIPSYL
ncbi:MAG: GDSL-type esterase/lipase family protein [Eubacteriales bacterium]|nr:GDSL-type esterase/lipase family protein [Eubacteriales bacterium]